MTTLLVNGQKAEWLVTMLIALTESPLEAMGLLVSAAYIINKMPETHQEGSKMSLGDILKKLADNCKEISVHETIQ